MHKPSTFLVLHCGQPDLAQDDRAVRRWRAPDLDEVILDCEVDKLMVGQPRRTCPHLGLMPIPVVPPLDDIGLDVVQDDIEGLDGLLCRAVRGVQVDFLRRC